MSATTGQTHLTPPRVVHIENYTRGCLASTHALACRISDYGWSLHVSSIQFPFQGEGEDRA
jgi:hypothetical protein